MSQPVSELTGGPISWMARHPVAANLLMVFFIVGGLIFALRMKQEVFPALELDVITVRTEYPGASPEEVEQGITLAIEDEARSIVDVNRVFSSSAENGSTVFVELLSGADADKALQELKNAVDRIRSFPEEAERPVVSLVEAQREVISLILYGPAEEALLRSMAEQVRDELLLKGDITLVELAAARPYEIAIEVPQENLRAYGLTLGEIASIIRRSAVELPAGGVKTESGEVLLRTQERRDFASEFANIPVLSRPDGSKVFLEDIAQLRETFEDTDREAYFNGQRAMRLNIFRVGDQRPLDIAATVHDYVKSLRERLPEGMGVHVWNDRSELFRDRINLLLKNAALGLILVLVLLGLFMEPRLAFWVMIGIPVSIVGAFLLVAPTDVSINMVSLFAFIITLGIVVDDAVVVGEIIYQKREEGLSHLEAAVLGAREIAGPVVFAVLTNMCAFMPLFFVPGVSGKIFINIPAITVAVFAVSLVESLYVLPAHLSHKQQDNALWRLLSRPTRWFNRGLKRFIQRRYKRHLSVALLNPYIVLGSGISLLIICAGLVGGGYVKLIFFPRIEGDVVTARAVMNFGVPVEDARALQEVLVRGVRQVVAESPEAADTVEGIYVQIGSSLGGGGPNLGETAVTGSHVVGVQVQLVPAAEREISGTEFARRWRSKVGLIPGLDSIEFQGEAVRAGGRPIDVMLMHDERAVLEEAAASLGSSLATYRGVSDIDTGVSRGKSQVSFKLTAAARSLGITAQDLAEQVRHAFFGARALRQQRGRNEVDVLVRLPENERSTVYTLETLMIRTPQGGEIPLSEAASIERGKAYTAIERTEGRRRISVTADVNDAVANSAEIVSDMQQLLLPDLIQRYPGLSYGFEGEQKDRQEAIDSLMVGGFLALVGIFTLLAIPFGSYLQPLIVMLSIPFGMVGALAGHVLLGYDVSMPSMFGIVALAGVVVNDSLVLVVTANRNREQKGMSTLRALRNAGIKRFRPIILTSLTTFFGLAPMIFETDRGARFLIPMAISLGFGILFSTAVILMIVPAAYVIAERMRGSYD